jgi:hypothetical protein
LNAEWGTRNNIISRNGTGMKLLQDGRPELPADLKQVLAEDK